MARSSTRTRSISSASPTLADLLRLVGIAGEARIAVVDRDTRQDRAERPVAESALQPQDRRHALVSVTFDWPACIWWNRSVDQARARVPDESEPASSSEQIPSLLVSSAPQVAQERERILVVQRHVGNRAAGRLLGDRDSAPGLKRQAAGGQPEADRARAFDDAATGALRAAVLARRLSAAPGRLLQRAVVPEGVPGSRPNTNVGDTGPGVKLLQRLLGAPETGTFDPATLAAVDRFQHQQGWGPSGVGPDTWKALDNHAGKPGSRPNLLPGDRGPGVRLLQSGLGVKETSVFDAATRKAVDRFQHQQGWDPSGVGPDTWKALDNHAGKPGSRPNLYAGDRGPGVRLLQSGLGVKETAVFDAATRTAVDDFQRRQGWAPSNVGPDTWKALEPDISRLQDLSALTRTVTAIQQADIEAILQPGSTVVVAPPPVVGVPAPPPTVVAPPAMTGAGPGGAFETEMTAFVKSYTKGIADAFKARKAAAPPSFAIADANDIAHAAQAAVEGYFDKWITAASRRPADKYHKGTYDLATVLGDQSTRSTTDPTKPNRFGWTSYWMSHGQGKTLTDKYHCSYSDRDRAEFERVRDKFVTDPANASNIDDAIHSWPGENSDKVYIQPWADPDPKHKRTVRWDLFTTLLHEMLHSLQHPNYVAAFTALGGTANELLKEGMLDVMRRDLWDPPGGDLGARLTKPAAAALRVKVEGASYPLDPAVIVYHNDYENLPDAQQIVAKVGLDNCKAAFFLGKVELLGLSADPAKTVTGAPLTNIASWEASDPANADIYDALAGETLATIALKCGVDAPDIAKDDGSALPAGYAPVAGARLKVKGIRYIHAVDGDTLASLARQNGVTPESLAAANNFPAGAPDTTPVPAGKRVLIPHRRS